MDKIQDITPKSLILIPMKEKVVLPDPTQDIGATIGGMGTRLASTVTEAINASGNLVKDVINEKLDTDAKTILDAFTFGASGALQIGTYVNGVTGDIRISPNGVVSRNSTGANTITIDGTTGDVTLAGTITATAGSIGGWNLSATAIYFDGATDILSAGMATADYPFYAGKKYADRATAPYRVTPAGALFASSATIAGALTATAGSSIATSYLSGTIAQANLNIANMGWTQTSVFSSTDLDTVSWGAGTLTTAGGASYSIGAGNTGNMAARTYIYLNIAVSTTAYQVTTTATTAVGAGKILVATAINGAVEATFEVFGGVGGIHVSAVDALVANSITAALMNVSQLSAISADLGTATAGSLTVTTGGNTVALTPASAIAFASGPTGSPTVTITQAGVLTATGAVINGYNQTNIGSFGGNGSDGALSISSGTTTINLGGVAYVVKNYTSISITGTGKLAFSNPHAGGTIIVLKSQGNITITASAPCIDASGMGATGGTGTADTIPTSGTNGNAILDTSNHYGTGGTDIAGGTGGVILSNLFFYTTSGLQLSKKAIFLACGSGGGGGAGEGTEVGGNGGRGGGALYIECAGALNFTTALGISVAGANGVNAVHVTGTRAGGGGAGGAGMCVILYNTLTSATGTINDAGGTGGTSAGDPPSGGRGGGAGGGAYGGAGGNGGYNGVGSNGGGTGAGSGGGSTSNTQTNVGGTAGAASGGLIAQNSEFA